MKLAVWLIALAVAPSFASAQTTRPASNFAGDPRMGVCTHFAQGWDYQKIMPEIEKSGFGWIRDDQGWEGIEAKKGEYHVPERTLAWIRSAHKHHLRVLLILNGSNKLYADPYDPQAFARWGAWVANELKNDVDALEILNEPNNFGFSKQYGGQHEGEGNSPWVAKYVTLMNATAEAIKAANPAMPVIGFGAGAPVTYKQLALGTSSAVDAIADHPYSNQTVPEISSSSAAEQLKRFGFSYSDDRGSFASLINGFHGESQKHHGPKGIWLTEWGYSTYQPLTAEQFGGFSDSAQAKYILRRYVEGFGLGVDVSFLYEFRDGRDNHDAEQRWGIVREDGEHKPSWDSIVNLAAIFHDLRAAKESEVGAVNVFPAAVWPQQSPIAVYRFIDSTGRPAVAIWGTDRADGDRSPRVADVELMWGAGVKEIIAIDTLSGRSETVAFKHQGSRLVKEGMTIRDYPVILKASDPAVAGAQGGAAAQVDLNLFDGKTEWGFNNGQEFPGAAGSFAIASDGGKAVGAVKYDFSKGGAYVAAQTKTDFPRDIAELRIGTKATQAVRISVRLVDGTGQCHQFVKACAGTGSWETLRVRMEERASEHWGGANDGKMHFPIRELSLCVAKPAADPMVNTIEFGDAVAVKQ